MCTYDITQTDLNPTVLFLGKHNELKEGRPHSHDNTELLFIFSGSSTEYIDDSVYPVSAGDVILINSGQVHHHVPKDSSEPVIMFFAGFTDFHFKGMEPNELILPDKSPILHTEGLVRQDISNLCMRMISERYSSQPGQYFMQKSYLIQLLLIIIRQIYTSPEEQQGACHFETHHKTYVVSAIQQYLTAHYAEKISLDLIAKNMYLSSAYISKIFKEETGEAPINYLIKLRLERARVLLESDSRQNIKSISTSVGYDDVYYFSKLFKKYFGVSPVNYRLRYNEREAKEA